MVYIQEKGCQEGECLEVTQLANQTLITQILLAVSGALFERLDSGGAQLAQPLVERVGALCAEAAEAEADRDEGEAAAPYEGAAAAAMGAAIRHLGPQRVLGILPLNIAEVLPRSCMPQQGRCWRSP